ncbi:unnamed protein product [Urochloa humidicola]
MAALRQAGTNRSPPALGLRPGLRQAGTNTVRASWHQHRPGLPAFASTVAAAPELALHLVPRSYHDRIVSHSTNVACLQLRGLRPVDHEVVAQNCSLTVQSGPRRRARGCCSRVGVDLSNICAGILHHLEDRLVPSAAAVDPNVFHLKMEGDYHLYLAERNAAADSTLDAYQAAQVALVFLSPGQFHEGAVVHAPHQAGPNMLDRQSDSPTRNAAELLYFHHMKDEAIR